MENEPVTPVSCHILLGGMVGPDGLIPGINTGMYGLRDMLNAIPGVTAEVRTWNRWQDLIALTGVDHMHNERVVVIGYSGGGSRATWLASALYNKPVSRRVIDLVVGYDPSPVKQVLAFGDNVKKAICYWNQSPFFFGYGGGQYSFTTPELTAARCVTVPIKEWHVTVDTDMKLHEQTIEAVKALQ